MSRPWVGDAVVVAAQRGDPVALATLVEGAYPGVQRFAHTLCATPDDAEDAAQEALLILFRKVGSLRAAAALSSWMFRIVRNECLRRLARPAIAVEPSVIASAEDEVLSRLEFERVAAAIAALPVDQRQVLVLRDVQGYSGRDVARVTGLTVAAMKSRLRRARSGLKEALDG